MKNLPAYFETEDDINVYRVEHNDDRTIATIYTMARGDDGKLYDAGDPREVDLTQSERFSDKHFDISNEVLDVVCPSRHRSKDKSRFEISDVDANGNVHKFVFENNTKTMNEYLNDEPVNRTLTNAPLYTAFRYAEQMLQIYCDECAFVVEDEKNDLTYGIYASPNNSKYYIFSYREDEYGITIVDCDTDWKGYPDLDSAIKEAKSYVDPDAVFDKLGDIVVTPDNDGQELTVSITLETSEGSTTKSYSYDFEEYCSDVGLETELDEDKFYEQYHDDHIEDYRFDWSCNYGYYEGHDVDDAFSNAQEEHYEDLYNDRYDDFEESAKMVAWWNIEMSADLHPADWERWNELKGEEKLILNPAVKKVKCKEEISRD